LDDFLDYLDKNVLNVQSSGNSEQHN